MRIKKNKMTNQMRLLKCFSSFWINEMFCFSDLVDFLKNNFQEIRVLLDENYREKQEKLNNLEQNLQILTNNKNIEIELYNENKQLKEKINLLQKKLGDTKMVNTSLFSSILYQGIGSILKK